MRSGTRPVFSGTREHCQSAMLPQCYDWENTLEFTAMGRLSFCKDGQQATDTGSCVSRDRRGYTNAAGRQTGQQLSLRAMAIGSARES